MSLQVWLPLNGDLHNQGLTNIIVTNNGATVDNNGKIGKCYNFNGTSSYLISNSTFLNNNIKDFSYTCWFKPTVNTQSMCLLTNRTETSSYGIGIFCKLNQGKILFDDGERFESLSSQIIIGQWNHLAFIRKKGQYKKVYLNGIEIASTTVTGIPTKANANKFTIGASQNTQNSVNGNYLKGYLNDVRIYDHALSAKEVKEISKALVLHYKLDGGPTFSPKNLLLNSKKDAGKSHTTYDIADFNFSQALRSGGNYTIIAKINTSSEKKAIGFYHSGGKISLGDWSPISENGIYKVKFTATSNMASQTSGSGHGFCRVYVSNNIGLQGSTPVTGTANVEWITLYNGHGEGIYISAEEYDGICYDSSGYNHNGTIIGEYAINGNTGKYKSSSWTNSSLGGYIAIKNQLYSMRDEMTVSLWVNKTWSSNTGTPFSSVEGGGFGWQCNGANYNFCCGTGVSSNAYITQALTVNNLTSGWHMLSATYDGLALRLYIDGVLKSTKKPYSTKTPLYYNNNSGMFIGRESNGNINTSSTDKFTGSISDVRIYATALSDEDILELYNTSASIDSFGNAYARELVE